MSDARTVIVCTPAGTPIDWFAAAEALNWHELPTGNPQVMFPVRRRRIIGWFSRWTTRHLVQALRRFGAVRFAAGGRTSRLDLNAAATLAHQQATYRWRLWTQVVRSTPAAQPWEHFLAQHTAAPAKVSVEEATRRFEAQARVLAMLAYNSHPYCQVSLDPYEIDGYQAGEQTYTALHWQRSICGDAVITDDGRLLAPASDSIADRLRFLTEAGAYVRRLDRRQHLLAVRIAARP